MLKLMAIFLLFSGTSQAAVKGEDNRIRYTDLQKVNPVQMAEATATQIALDYYVEGQYPTGRLQNQCPGEKYSSEFVMGGCSGFLIGPKTLVAAAHCNDYANGGCSKEAWVFRHYAPATPNKQKIAKENVYRCSKVLDRRYDQEGDYVVIELDRAVPGVRPLELDLKDEGRVGDPVAILGYPLGRSFTYTPGGSITEKDPNFIKIDSDSFKNNSGSAIVNLRTGKIEGVLTNSRRGMSLHEIDGCQLAKSFKESFSLGNRLIRIPYLNEKFNFTREVTLAKVKNTCGQALSLTYKYREKITNDWKTQVVRINKEDHIYIRNFRNATLYLNARSLGGVSFLSGKDFFGFIDSSRRVELGFKELKVKTGEDINICN